MSSVQSLLRFVPWIDAQHHFSAEATWNTLPVRWFDVVNNGCIPVISCENVIILVDNLIGRQLFVGAQASDAIVEAVLKVKLSNVNRFPIEVGLQVDVRRSEGISTFFG